MSETLKQVKALSARGDVKISEHGYDQLAEEGIVVRDLIDSLTDAELLEDYPDFPKGPCALLLHRDRKGNPVHVVWGIPKGKTAPAVLVTAYRPDPEKWTGDFRRRKQ